MESIIRIAENHDLKQLLPLVMQYHEFEGIQQSLSVCEKSLAPLLATQQFGYILILEQKNRLIGYIAVCFGYSIEFAGRDAFIDEFYLLPEFRSKGYGRQMFEKICDELRQNGFKAMHLEVKKSNKKARLFYEKWGFNNRECFNMMTHSISN